MVFRFLLSAGFVFSCISISASAEILNDEKRFAEISPCQAYLDFLEGKPPNSVRDCRGLPLLVTSHRGSSISTYLDAIAEQAGGTSPLALMARVVGDVPLGDPESIYVVADLADRAVYAQMEGAQDSERAHLYAEILSRLKKDLINVIADRDVGWERSPLFKEPISTILGEEFRDLDEAPSEFLLMCLLRTDAYHTPVRDVLRSDAFDECLP